MRTNHIIWHSIEDKTRLLELDTSTRQVTVPAYALTLHKLRELHQACEEALGLLTTPTVATPTQEAG
jgi:hypothetical protein